MARSILLAGAGVEMEQMDMAGGKMMLMSPAWRPRYAALVFAMWAIMMVGMMLPSAASATLKVWTGFSFAATLLQWALDSAHLLSETMAIRVVAGVRESC